MKWSYSLGEFFGIGVRLHLTFLLLLGWIGLSTLVDTGSIAAAVASTLFIAAIFAFVVMHEYGHALTARAFGVRTRNITLYPIGGVAMLERMPDKPGQQLLIALAGPAVNFALAAGFVLALSLLGSGLLPFGAAPDTAAGVLSIMFWVNVGMGAFNLLPAMPMDGGRVLRAALALRLDPMRATRIAARVARVVAVLMALYALAPPVHVMLLVIAAFVWFAAGAERAAEERLRYARARGYVPPGFPSAQAGPSGYQGPVIVEGGPGRPGERFVVRVVDGPFGPRLHLTRIG